MILAMWSGPRNLSTAMMRSWENRSDTVVTDEPFYGHYLNATGIEHPGAAAVMRSQVLDWREVARTVAIPRSPADAQPVWYQKHITTHMLDHIELDFLQAMQHCFLIRRPRLVVASYARKREAPTVADLGFEQQRRLFEHVKNHQGVSPPVIDAEQFLHNPEYWLRWLCEHVGLPFQQQMLEWPAGARESDGVWHTHWYDAVKASTGFAAAPTRRAEPDIPASLLPLVDACQPHYDYLLSHHGPLPA